MSNITCYYMKPHTTLTSLNGLYKQKYAERLNILCNNVEVISGVNNITRGHPLINHKCSYCRSINSYHNGECKNCGSTEG